MGGLYVLLCFTPSDIGQLKTKYGIDKKFSIRWRIEVEFSHRATNQLCDRGLSLPRQGAQLLERSCVHQKLDPPTERHFSLLDAATYQYS
jgi:hypothetical protein